MKFTLILGILCLFLSACEKKDPNVVSVKTNFGTIKVRLYDDTPLHRDNFLKLAREGYYEGILFHRVIPQFVIQAGDPDSRQARSGMILGANEIGYQIEAEICPQHYHRKGVLAAAREGDNVNPERKSSGSHFYIVQGKIFRPAELDSAVEQINDKRYQMLFEQLQKQREPEIRAYELAKDYGNLEKVNEELSLETRRLFEQEKLVLTEEQKNAYTTVGGIPHLDGAYTVFGEVVEGLEVVDKITALKTDGHNRPLKDVVILKME